MGAAKSLGKHRRGSPPPFVNLPMVIRRVQTGSMALAQISMVWMGSTDVI